MTTPQRRGRGRSAKTLELVAAAIAILREIQPASVRAVCYQLFVRKLLTSMSKANTNMVSRQLVWARESGQLPWRWIVDETRRAERAKTWRDPEQIINAAINGYRRDYWTDQPAWLEVWSEKGTVRGTLAPVLDEYGITFRVMHGHASATTLHEVALLTRRSEKRLVVLYVGDRDPSGQHMSDVDLPARLQRYGAKADVIRIAIDDEDTDAGVPSFPAADKVGDPRYEWYVENYGTECWELDALNPAILRDRVAGAIRSYLDEEAWNHAVEVEQAEVASMREFFAGYPGISGLATEYGRSP